jgi:hypothetical protein
MDDLGGGQSLFDLANQHEGRGRAAEIPNIFEIEDLGETRIFEPRNIRVLPVENDPQYICGCLQPATWFLKNVEQNYSWACCDVHLYKGLRFVVFGKLER